MLPNFEIFNKTLSAYVVMAAIGFLVTLFVMYKGAKKSGLDEMEVLFMLLFSGIGILVGGHLLFGITNMDYIILLLNNLDTIDSFSELMKHLGNIFGGGVFYGGLIGALIVALIYIKVKKLDKKSYLNYMIMAVPLFHIFGRIGCFLSGCCFGVEWEYGITYHNCAIEMANGVPRFPVQLVEAFLNIIIFLLLMYIYKNTKYKYKTVYIYFITYGVCRFILEFFRGDDYRGFLFSLSTSQIISILLIAFAVVMLIVEHVKEKKNNTV